MRWTVLTTTFVAGVVLLLGGCASTYYRITDPQTDRVYYAEDYDASDTGAVTFEDARTGKLITVQNSEIEAVTEDQFVNAVYREEEAAP